MSDKLRPIKAAEEGVQSATSKAKGKLLDWLPRKTCEHCGSLCTAEQEFVERQAMVCPIWKCPDCSSRYHREEDSPLSFDMWR
jgi:hypothetical protein